jgi:ankyrin repeat protein
MTTKINFSKGIKSVIIIALLFNVFSCNNEEKNSQSTANASTETATKVEAPSTDLPTAVFFGNLEAVNQHVAAGTDLNVKDEYGSTPLHVATTFGRTDIAIALIKGGADLTLKNNEGSSPLHIVAFFCRTEIVEALLEKGVDKSVANNYGATALQSVQGPFENVKPIYDEMAKNLGPFGLKLDYEQIEKTRPVIEAMLQ